MPLSEQEQRLLEEMERSLYHNDADFVAGTAGRHGRPTYTTIVTGVLIGVVGIATLIAGVGVRLPVVGVLGFILMFAGVLIALTPARGAATPRPTAEPGQDGAPSVTRPGSTFLRNLSDRWEKRADDPEK